MDLSKEGAVRMDADPANDTDTIKSDGVKETQADEERKGEKSDNKTQLTTDDEAENDDHKVNVTESSDKIETEEQNVSSSWVFVDVKSSAGKSDNPRRFYLNCSEEPVQELHQHELSAHSGSDSDTDGISVISESDPSRTDEEGVLHSRVFKETIEDVKVESEAAVRQEETQGTREVSQMIRTSAVARKSALTLNQLSYLAAFSIVVLLIPLQWYFQLYDFDRKEVETTVKVPNIPSKIEIDPQKAEYVNSDRLKIDDPLAYCTKIYENSDYMYRSRNVKKCMKKLEQVKEKLNRVHQKLQNTIPESDDVDGQAADIEEIHLNYKAEYSKLNNNENKNEVYTKKVKYRKPHEGKSRKNYEKEYRITRNTTNKEAQAYKFEYYSDNDKSTSTVNNQEIDSKHRPKINEEENLNKYSDYENKLKAKEKYLKEKEQYLQQKEKALKEREMKSHKITDHVDEKNDKVQNRSSNNYNDSKMKKKFYRQEAVDQPDDSDKDTDKRHGKKKATKYSSDFSSNDDSSTEYRAKHSQHKINKKNEKDHPKQKNRQSAEKSNEKNGGWYNDLFEERSKLRKRNHNTENNRLKRKSHKNRYKSEEDDDTQNGHWYSKLFAGRAKLRKNTDKYFMKDDDLMSEYKMYSNRYRSDSFSL